MIFDTHPHILAADTKRYRIDPIGGTQSAWSKNASLTAEDLLHAMDVAGVVAATVVQASTVYGDDNSYVADSVLRFPQRFVGVGGIDPRTVDAIERLTYWVKQRRLGGMRVFAGGSTVTDATWLDGHAIEPFWDAAEQLQVPINIQVRFGDLHRIGVIAARHPALRIIVDNLGLPPLDDPPFFAGLQPISDLAKHTFVFLKYTNSNLAAVVAAHARTRTLIHALLDRFASDRIMWGSNFPNLQPPGPAPYTVLVEEAKDALAECPPAVRASILGGTAGKLYPQLMGGRLRP